MFEAAWFLAKKDVAHMLRQKETLLWVFLMPILFFYFIGTVTGGFGGSGGDDEPDTLALRAPDDAGFLLDELIGRLEDENYRIERFDSAADPSEFGKHSRRLTVPDPAGGATFTEGVLAGEQALLTFDRRGQGTSTNFDRVRVQRAVYTVLADLAAFASEGVPPSPAEFTRLSEAPRALTLEVEPAGKREHIPTGYEQTIPGTLVMFTMLVLLTSGSISLVIERQQGLLRRLASTPISRGSVVLGKWTGRMALGLVQIGFAMLAGTLLFGVRWGDSLPMVGLVLIAWAAFNASLGTVLANLVRTEAQMAGIGVLTSLVLAALGGCWWPIEITPQWMQSLQLLLPTGWIMDAMHKLVNFGYGPGSALPQFLVTSLFALALGWVGAKTFRYQ